MVRSRKWRYQTNPFCSSWLYPLYFGVSICHRIFVHPPPTLIVVPFIDAFEVKDSGIVEVLAREDNSVQIPWVSIRNWVTCVAVVSFPQF